MAQIVEHLIATDDYNKPYTLKDKDALAVILIRLLIMDPGTNPLHPEAGVGLVRRYRFSSPDDMPTLNREIDQQIRVYLPQFSYVNVECTFVEGAIHVNISIDDTLFAFTTETDAAKILPGQIILSNSGY